MQSEWKESDDLYHKISVLFVLYSQHCDGPKTKMSAHEPGNYLQDSCMGIVYEFIFTFVIRLFFFIITGALNLIFARDPSYLICIYLLQYCLFTDSTAPFSDIVLLFIIHYWYSNAISVTYLVIRCQNIFTWTQVSTANAITDDGIWSTESLTLNILILIELFHIVIFVQI